MTNEPKFNVGDRVKYAGYKPQIEDIRWGLISHTYWYALSMNTGNEYIEESELSHADANAP